MEGKENCVRMGVWQRGGRPDWRGGTKCNGMELSVLMMRATFCIMVSPGMGQP